MPMETSERAEYHLDRCSSMQCALSVSPPPPQTPRSTRGCARNRPNIPLTRPLSPQTARSARGCARNRPNIPLTRPPSQSHHPRPRPRPQPRRNRHPRRASPHHPTGAPPRFPFEFCDTLGIPVSRPPCPNGSAGPSLMRGSEGDTQFAEKPTPDPV
jgi:hypothetical protein